MTESGLTAEQRRALELLASDPHGVAEGLLVLGHGFDSDMIADLVRQELATVKRMEAAGKTYPIVRVRITAAGRKAVEG